MNKIKDSLVGTLGVIGYILWIIIGALTMFTPLAFLDIPFWISLLIIIAIIYLPFIGGITNFIIWVLSFVVVVSGPIDSFSIAYFIIFAIYCLTAIIPTAISIIGSIVSIIVSILDIIIETFNNKSNN